MSLQILRKFVLLFLLLSTVVIFAGDEALVKQQEISHQAQEITEVEPIQPVKTFSRKKGFAIFASAAVVASVIGVGSFLLFRKVQDPIINEPQPVFSNKDAAEEKIISEYIVWVESEMRKGSFNESTQFPNHLLTHKEKIPSALHEGLLVATKDEIGEAENQVAVEKAYQSFLSYPHLQLAYYPIPVGSEDIYNSKYFKDDDNLNTNDNILIILQRRFPLLSAAERLQSFLWIKLFRSKVANNEKIAKLCAKEKSDLHQSLLQTLRELPDRIPNELQEIIKKRQSLSERLSLPGLKQSFDIFMKKISLDIESISNNICAIGYYNDSFNMSTTLREIESSLTRLITKIMLCMQSLERFSHPTVRHLVDSNNSCYRELYQEAKNLDLHLYILKDFLKAEEKRENLFLQKLSGLLGADSSSVPHISRKIFAGIFKGCSNK